MTDAPDFSKFVPGFDFLQNLAQGAGAAMPGFNQWVAPTLDPDEIDKRIKELRTVQFWLEQNSRLLATTIQALEVQRMTLSTLKTMNVQMGDLRESLKIRMPSFDAAATPAPASQASAKAPAAAARAAARSDAADESPARVKAKSAPAQGAAAAAAVDPTQWWNALAGQFAQIAGNAMKSVPGAAASTGGETKATPASVGPAAKPRKTGPARARKAAARRPADKG